MLPGSVRVNSPNNIGAGLHGVRGRVLQHHPVPVVQVVQLLQQIS
jgi:hypothetical protein